MHVPPALTIPRAVAALAGDHPIEQGTDQESAPVLLYPVEVGEAAAIDGMYIVYRVQRQASPTVSGGRIICLRSVLRELVSEVMWVDP